MENYTTTFDSNKRRKRQEALRVLVVRKFVKYTCILLVLVFALDGVISQQTLTAIPHHVSQRDISKVGITERTDIRASFDEVSHPGTDSIDGQKEVLISENSAVSMGVSDTGQAVVFTLVDSASSELQQRADLSHHMTNFINEEQNVSFAPTVLVPPSNASTAENKTEETQTNEDYIVRAEPKVIGKDTNPEVIETNDTEPVNDDNTQKIIENNTAVEEDIPSFSEWTEKQLKEAEKKEKVNSSTQNVQKIRSKNYASPDCGAKILAANPEAASAGSVLTSSRDEYKLNKCTSKIWFIVELCEAIQAKKIDLANFELFSSTPKDFVVSVSDRFPTRDWSSVGNFQAKDERNIQSFNLHPHLFGKFIKVEVNSHWGSEHYCPISIFRVYGTSEFEVLETEDRNDDDIEENDEMDYKGEPAANLFGSARDAVMSIVKKAAEVLVKSGNSNATKGSNYIPVTNTCTTPSHLIVCDNCSDALYEHVYEILSCSTEHLIKLVRLPVIEQIIYNTHICVDLGLNVFTKTKYNQTDAQCDYVMRFFPPKYLAGLCNIVAVIENKVLLNITNPFMNVSTEMNNTDALDENFGLEPTSCEPTEIKTCRIDDTQTLADEESNIPIELQIKPTKTIESSSVQSEIETSVNSTNDEVNLDPSEVVQEPTISVDVKNSSQEEKKSVDSTNMPEIIDEHLELDKILSELYPEPVTTTVTPPSTTHQQGQKESVFLRLSNRIKALERNMSLSGQYLEELSRRYKKQVEEMQRVFEKKLYYISEECKRHEQRELVLQEQLEKLTATVDSLRSDRNTFWEILTLIALFFLIVYTLFIVFHKNETDYNKPKIKKEKLVTRRISIDTVGHESPIIQRKRRPSEEALNITGTYKDLLITDENDGVLSKAEKRRRRKRKALLRSQSVIAKDIESPVEDERTRRASSSEMTKRTTMPPPLLPPPTNCLNGHKSVLKIEEVKSVSSVATFPTIHSEAEELYTKINDVNNGSIRSSSSILKSYTPLFMKTALSSRSKRNSTKKVFKTDNKSSTTNSSHMRNSQDLSINNLSDSDQTSLNSEKKKSSFKRLFKRLFE